MRYFSSLSKSVAYVLSLALIYYFHGYRSNQIYGYGQIEFDLELILTMLSIIFFLAFLIGRGYKKPSDFFLLLYGLIVVVPNAILTDVWGRGGRVAAGDLILIIIPIFGILLICKLNFRLPKFSFLSEAGGEKIIFLLSAITIAMLLFDQPSTASFSLVDSYTRRLEARDIYKAETLQAYLSSMVMNGVLPLLTFIGVLRNHIFFLLISLCFYLTFFYIYGVKAPIMYMIFSGLFAYSLKKYGSGLQFYRFIFYFLFFCIFFAWLEFFLFDYSYLEDYFIRRLFYVSSYLSGAYFELIGSDKFSWVYGFIEPTSKSISMYVGEDFLGLQGANANTNTFLYFLASYGAFGYIFVILLVGMVFSFLDSLRFRNQIFVLISMLYSLLLLEQSATTALVSSGIGFLSILYFFVKNSREA